MNGIAEGDEVLERLWQLAERGGRTLAALEATLRGRCRPELLQRLAADGLFDLNGEEVVFTEKGKARAGSLIRAHRVGERLIHDVLGRAFEPGACEFEHILNTEIVDGICTLLGHPRECPHGFPIPEGECCRESARYVQQVIVPLSELKIGQTARVAYVYTKSDQQLHRLTSLQIRPGTIVKLHQAYPSYVIECAGASIAMDEEVAGSINVWIEGESPVVLGDMAPQGDARPPAGRPNFTRPRWRWRFGARREP